MTRGRLGLKTDRSESRTSTSWPCGPQPRTVSSSRFTADCQWSELVADDGLLIEIHCAVQYRASQPPKLIRPSLIDRLCDSPRNCFHSWPILGWKNVVAARFLNPTLLEQAGTKRRPLALPRRLVGMLHREFIKQFIDQVKTFRQSPNNRERQSFGSTGIGRA